MKYLQINGVKKKFDCCHLAAAFLKGELGINTSNWNSVSREYDLRKEAEYIHDEMLKVDMVDVDDSYQKGDVIIYSVGKYRAAVATCVNDKVALLLKRVSEETHIDRIENKIFHMRHESLV
jgi:hypothetical protein